MLYKIGETKPTKEEFPMSSMALLNKKGRSIALLVGLAALALAAPWLGEMIWAQQSQVPLALDVARGDQEITLLGAQGGQAPPGGRDDQPFGDGLGKIAKGDFNGDGITDLAVGVPQANPEMGFTRGAVYLLFGRPGIEAFPVCRNPAFRRCFDAAGAVGPLPDVAIAGARGWWYLGETVGSGDLNGDGFDDILVGAGTSDGSGSVFAIFGRPVFPSQTTIAAEGQKLTINGANPGDWLVVVARQSRDVNGDGIDDFLFAAPNASPGGERTQVRSTSSLVAVPYFRSPSTPPAPM